MYSLIEYESPVISNELMLHALFSKVTNNRLKKLKTDMYRQPDFKIWDDEYKVFIVVDENNEDLFSELNCQDFEFFHENQKITLKFKNKSSFECFNVEKNTVVRFRGMLSYARKEKSKHICPVKGEGFISMDEKQKFVEYFLNNTGIAIKDCEVQQISAQRLPSSKSKTNGQDVLLNNIFGILGVGIIEDNEKAKRLMVSSVGKKRSYGLGNVFIE